MVKRASKSFLHPYHSPTAQSRQEVLNQFFSILLTESRSTSRSASPASEISADPNVISLNSPPLPARPVPPPMDGQLTDEQQVELMINQAVTTAIAPLLQRLAEKDEQIHNMNQQLQALANQPAPAPTPAIMVQPAPFKIQPPENFTGDRNQFKSWLSQLHLYFLHIRDSLTTDRRKVLLACTFIKNPAFAFVAPIVDSADKPGETPPPELDDYEKFLTKLHVLFGPHDPKGEAQRKLQSLKQKKDMSVEQYAAEFQRWQVLTGWNDESLISQFKRGLLEHSQMLMIPVEPQPKTIYDYMTKAAEMDSRWRMVKNAHIPDSTVRATPISVSAPAPDPDAMDLSRMPIRQLQDKVPKEEWTRRLKENCCLNCGRFGHRNFNCRSQFSTTPPPPSRFKPSMNRVAAATTSSTSAVAPPASTSTPPPAANMSQESLSRLIVLMEGVLQGQQRNGGQSGPSSGF